MINRVLLYLCESRSKGEHITSATILSVSASGIAALTSFFLAWVLGADVFGLYSLTLSVSGIVGVPMLMSLNFVMYQDLPRSKNPDRSSLIATSIVCLFTLMMVVLTVGFVATPWLARLIGVESTTFRLGITLATGTSANLLTESLLRGLNRFAFAALLKLITVFSYLLYCIGQYFLDHNLNSGSYIEGLIALDILVSLIMVAATRFDIRSASRKTAAHLLQHGSYMSVISLLATVLFSIDVIFLNYWSNHADVGTYSVYSGLSRGLLGVIVTDGMGFVLLPLFATMIKPALLAKLRQISLFLGAATFAVAFIGTSLFLWVLHARYSYSALYVFLTALGVAIHTIYNIHYFAISMDGVRGAKWILVILSSTLPIAVGIQVILIRCFALKGALIAFICTNGIILIFTLIVELHVYVTTHLPATSEALDQDKGQPDAQD